MMDIRIDRASSVPVYLQIDRGLRALIASGALPQGALLPPERRLAASLGVNRTTILNAYRELKADGLVESHVGSGTRVAGNAAVPRDPAGPLPWSQLIRVGGEQTPDPLVRDLLELSERRDVISLAVGLPAPELLPLDLVGRLHGTMMREMGAGALLHSPTEGLSQFRETLCGLMATRGVRCSLPEVLVTSGSQQGLDLLARVLLDPGDEVVVEEPSYFGALQVFRRAGARLLGVGVDAAGMRTDALETLLQRRRPKLIYTLPTFQNPSGAVLSLARRRHLLDLAYRFQVPVVEDDPYSELRYEGSELPSLKALDVHGHVIYASSFSKVLFPGLRVGWLVAPSVLVRQLALAKQSVDLHTTTPGQWLIHRFIGDGHFQRHLAHARQAYRVRRDAMDEALRASAPPTLEWERPEGGFYFWCRSTAPVPQGRLLGRAAAEGVAYLPGEACFASGSATSFMRLNFTYPTCEQIRSGIAGLMTALRRVTPAGDAQGAAAGGTPPIV